MSLIRDTKTKTQKETEKNLQKKTSVIVLRDYLYSRYDIRKNIITLDYEYKKKEDEKFEKLNFSDLWLQCHENNYTHANLSNLEAIIKSSHTIEYNPGLEYLENLPEWDGIDYFEKLSTYLPIAEIENYKFVYHFKKWFVRLVKCMVDDNFFNKQMIVFIQEEHNGGKTTFCRWLCPHELEQYYTESITEGKDEQIQLTTNFLISYDEMSKLTKESISKVKSLMSTLNVNLRLPYEKKQIKLNRRCSFLGNTNKIEFMLDETGSIRFICFELTGKLNFDYSKDININNLYAQAYNLLKSKTFEYEITHEDSVIIQEYNKRFFVQTPEIYFIQKYYRIATEDDKQLPDQSLLEYKTSTQIYLELQKRVPEIKFNINNIGKALVFLNYKRTMIRNKDFKNHPYPCYEICQNEEF